MKKKQLKSVKMLKGLLEKKEFIIKVFNQYDIKKLEDFLKQYPDASGMSYTSTGVLHINELEKIMKQFKKDLKNAKKS